MSAARAFPADFTWGTATASYQIEGAVREDGRTASIWDTFSHTPGRVVGGDTGDVADDHYHRWEEDLDHLARLGVGAYRFSIAWPRVQPGGKGPVNQRGIDFYSRLIDGLAERGIDPVVTLYHWDLPQELQDAGGWPARDTALRFGDYAQAMAAAFGDRVSVWTTHNEPWCAAFLGYGEGVHAPGIRDNAQALAAAHHLNLSHGLASRAIRAEIADATVSITLNLHVNRPASDDPRDLDAVRRLDAVGNRIWLDPIFAGHYPPDLLEDTAHITDWSFVRDGDLATCHAPVDVLGINYYTTNTVRGRETTGPARPSAWPGDDGVEWLPAQPPTTAMGWHIDASGLTDLLVRVSRAYPRLPLMVTENGSAFPDEVSPDGAVHDPRRVDYLHRHLIACLDALDQGVNLRGYFAWSLLDNFEWAEGYAKRFGIIHVDYATQQRRWKDSAFALQQVIATGIVPEPDQA